MSKLVGDFPCEIVVRTVEGRELGERGHGRWKVSIEAVVGDVQ